MTSVQTPWVTQASRKLYAFGFFWDLVFIYAIDKLLFLEHGLSMTQIALLMSLWAAIVIILEVPSGLLADYWDRRSMLIVAGIARIGLCFAWLLADGFVGFLIGFGALAVSQSFLSGTTQAYLHDVLQQQQQEKNFERFWGRFEFFRLAGLTIAWAVGGAISISTFAPALWLSLLSGLLCTIMACTLPRLTKQVAVEEQNPFRHLLTTLRYSFQHPLILRVFLFAAFVRSTYIVIDEYWPVYLTAYGFSRPVLGICVAASTLIGSASGVVAYRFRNKAWRTITIGTAIFATILIATSISGSWIIVIPMLALESIVGIMTILTEGVLQTYAVPTQRASTSSVSSLLKEAGIISGIIFGFIVEYYNLHVGYGFFAICILLYFPAQWMWTRKKKLNAN